MLRIRDIGTFNPTEIDLRGEGEHLYNRLVRRGRPDFTLAAAAGQLTGCFAEASLTLPGEDPNYASSLTCQALAIAPGEDTNVAVQTLHPGCTDSYEGPTVYTIVKYATIDRHADPDSPTMRTTRQVLAPLDLLTDTEELNKAAYDAYQQYPPDEAKIYVGGMILDDFTGIDFARRVDTLTYPDGVPLSIYGPDNPLAQAHLANYANIPQMPLRDRFAPFQPGIGLHPRELEQVHQFLFGASPLNQPQL